MLNFAIVPVAVTLIELPAWPWAGAAVIAGRGAGPPPAANRYGGE